MMSWNRQRWTDELNQHHVLVMTHDLFQNHLLTPGHLPLTKINLIIFDECHHTTKNHPYAQIMRRFSSCPKKERPRILGLSASIISGKCKPGTLSEKLTALEKTLHCRIETARDIKEVSRYVTNPEESFAIYHPCKGSQAGSLKRCLQKALCSLNACAPTKKKGSIVEELKNSLNDCDYILDNVNISSALSAAQISIGEIQTMLQGRGHTQQGRRLAQLTLDSLTSFAKQCHVFLQTKGDESSA